jgi:hypothetical protein
MTQAAAEHLLAGLLLVARAGDIGSTYLATPRLMLEANPVARRLGWPFALLTLLAALIPYYNLSAGVVVLVPSLLVASRNFGSIWLARAVGEEGVLALQLQAARRTRFSEAMMYAVAESMFMAGVGLLLMLIEGRSRAPGILFALGVLAWAFALLVHRTAHLRRVYRLARESLSAAGSPAPK